MKKLLHITGLTLLLLSLFACNAPQQDVTPQPELKTYTNAAWKLKLSYPTDFTLDEKDSINDTYYPQLTLLFGPTTVRNNAIFIKKETKIPFSDFMALIRNNIKETDKGRDGDRMLLEESDLTINGTVVKRFVTGLRDLPNSKTLLYYFKADDGTYGFETTAWRGQVDYDVSTELLNSVEFIK